MNTDIKQSPEFWDTQAEYFDRLAAEARTEAFRLRSEQGEGQPRHSVKRGTAAHRRLLGLDPDGKPETKGKSPQEIEAEAQKAFALALAGTDNIC